MSQNFKQNKTRNLMLYYSVAISVILAIILLSLWLSPVYAATNANEVSIKEIKQIKAGVSQYHVVLNYCFETKLNQPIGVVVSSGIGKNIVALDTSSKIGTCSPYVTKINAEKTSNIVATLFGSDKVNDLTKEFESRLTLLQEKKIQAYQKLQIEESLDRPNHKKIEHLEKDIIKLDQSIQNSKASIRILKTL